MTTTDAVARVCELAQQSLSVERVPRTKRRQGDVFTWRETDYLPMQFVVPVPELDDLPSYDWREQWEDPAKSFVEQMKNIIAYARSGSDYLPSLRADLGVICVPSLFGVGYEVPAHTKPVTTTFIDKETLSGFKLPADIRALGVMPRLVEHTHHHLSMLNAHGLADCVGVHHCDTQGPFDIACQVFGHELYTEFYDDPEFVHQLLHISTQAYIGVTRLCRELSGETGAGGNASGFWMEQGGVRLCDDSAVLLSTELFTEFSLPYHRQALEAFGGGWIHYCGGVPEGGRMEGVHLHDLYCSFPHLRGFNFTTGYDWEAEIRKTLAHQIAYVGWLPRRDGEALEAYFTRVLSLCNSRTGLIFQAENAIKSEEVSIAMAVWHHMQDARQWQIADMASC